VGGDVIGQTRLAGLHRLLSDTDLASAGPEVALGVPGVCGRHTHEVEHLMMMFRNPSVANSGGGRNTGLI
jgi:hypothetical protein